MHCELRSYHHILSQNCSLPSAQYTGLVKLVSISWQRPITLPSLLSSHLLVEWYIGGEMAQRGVFLTSTFNKSSQPDFFEVKPYTVSPSRRSDSVLKMKLFETLWRPRYQQRKVWLKLFLRPSDISSGICPRSSTLKTGPGAPVLSGYYNTR